MLLITEVSSILSSIFGKVFGLVDLHLVMYYVHIHYSLDSSHGGAAAGATGAKVPPKF